MALAVALSADVAPAQERVLDDDQAAAVAEAVERLRALRAEAEALLDALAPELRREVERRLEAEDREVSPESADPESTSPETAPEAETSVDPPPSPAEPPAEATPAEGTGAAPPRAAAPAAVGAEPSPGPAAAAAEPPPPARATQQPARAPRRTCNTLALFDSSGDGLFSGSDRHWRHFYLWNDDGDAAVSPEEITSLFDAGVRQVRLDLQRFDAVGDRSGEIEVGAYIVLRSPSARRSKFANSGRLVLDTDDVLRSRGPRLVGPSGETLAGLQPIVAGLSLVLPDGQRIALDCP